MSYIEDGCWKTYDGSPIMVVPTTPDNRKFIIITDEYLFHVEEGWCDNCQNPNFTWTQYDMTGEAIAQSIGGYVTIELAYEDIRTEF